LQELRLTPTTADPLVATLFGLWAARYGEAVVEICELQSVAALIGTSNWNSRVELEVVISVPPIAFTEQYVGTTISVRTAREFLAEMGFELAPGFVNLDEFRFRLYSTPRLHERQIAEFDDKVLGRG